MFCLLMLRCLLIIDGFTYEDSKISLPLDNYGDDGIMISADRMHRGASLSVIYHDSSAVEGRDLTVFCESFIKKSVGNQFIVMHDTTCPHRAGLVGECFEIADDQKVSDQPEK
ncbi:hypothetical protein TNCT_727581 [Trichonephila clavata]|uniref:Uncharacterized protein n=1 Tax=Trichonephila clavata TaxID=2740835 RepID=A0A8X6LFX1_TRICU|nr:hypothetical protein TNCT_727581 [Trichonephila clavata]